MQTGTYTLQGLLPAYRPDTAVVRPAILPYGGPLGSGGAYPTGSGLGLVPGTAQSEIATLTVNSATGTLTLTFTADRAYVVTHAYNASLATVKTAWEAVFGTGNVAVTGTAGTTYILTLQGALANKRVGGLFSAASSDGTAAWARTQRGNCGADQYDYYDGSTVTTIDALLKEQTALNPRGGRATDVSAGSEQPYTPPAFVEGFFNYGDIPNVASGAIGNDKKLGYATGSASATTGAVLRLSQKN